MAVITMLKKDLISASGLSNPEDTVPKIGMEVEYEKDGEIAIDITPNRPDLLDIVGLGRELALHEGLRKPASYEISSNKTVYISVGNAVKNARPHIAGITVTGVSFTEDTLRYLINFSEKIGETLGRGRRKLAIGIHDLSKIKGDLEYDAAYTGNITTLAEGRNMEFSQVLEESQKGIEYFETVPHKNGRPLFPFLKDSEKVIALIPITNSEATKVTKETKDLFIDFTGTDPYVVSKVADIFACRFIDIGAKVGNVVVKGKAGEIKFPKLETKRMKLNEAGLSDIIGYKPKNIDIKKLSKLAGYIVDSGDSHSATVTVPAYRYDILNTQDAYEDLLFAYEYDSIDSLVVPSINPGMKLNFSEFEETLSGIAIGLGYTEAYNNYLTNEAQEFEKMSEKPDIKKVVKVKYSKTENISILRSSILPSLIRNLADSASDQMPYRIFEMGEVFSVSGKKSIEGKSFAFASEHPKADFAEAKATVNAVFKALGIKISLKVAHSEHFIEGRCASVFNGDKRIGIFGEINPSILVNFGIEEPAIGCEIDLAAL